jgi:hypothetical protein
MIPITKSLAEASGGNDSSGTRRGWDPSRAEETDAERADRNLVELLQELRVAALGVQVLFGFLLSLPFTSRFSQLDATQRALYGISIGSSAIATALLVTPVAYHRLVFRQHQKEQLLRVSNGLALGGLAAVGIAITTALSLIFDVVYRGLPAALAGGAIIAAYLFVWVLLPVSGRRR